MVKVPPAAKSLLQFIVHSAVVVVLSKKRMEHSENDVYRNLCK